MLKKNITEKLSIHFRKKHKVRFNTWRFLMIIALFSTSCQNQYKSLSLQKSAVQKEISSIFEKREKVAVFNTSFQFKDYFTSGLMIIKPMELGNFRIVFTAKTGQKILDTELSPDNFKVMFAVKQLDRKLLIKLLENDLRLICDNYSGQFDFLKNEQRDIYRLRIKKGFGYFIYDNLTNELITIERGNKRRKRVIASLENYRAEFPEKITFAHQNLDLKIEMKLIQ